MTTDSSHSPISSPPDGVATGTISTAARRPVNWRSVLLGLIGVTYICGLTPYNDYAVNNTYLVGNFLPIGLLLFFLLFVLVINAPLSRWTRRWAFSSGEMAVAFGMALVSCALPSSGLMRYLPGQLVGPWYFAGSNPDYRTMLDKLDLPDWMFPRFAEPDVIGRANDPLVQNFYGRIPVEQDTFWARFTAVPWEAWLTPALTWGLLIAAIFGAVMFLSIIVRRQWVENERLSFPLATVYLSLLESPAPGRGWNALFRSRLFWIAFAAVMFIHLFNGLHKYNVLWPEIPVRFNLGSLMSDPPLSYLHGGMKENAMFFVIIGITYFVQTKIAFSLWFFYCMYNVVLVFYGSMQTEFRVGMQRDQLYGAIIPFALSMVWVGRQHWAIVLRQMVGRGGEDDPRGRYLPYSLAGWGLVACLLIAVGWLWVAGATLIGAIVLILSLMTLFMVLARVVAETGLAFVQIPLGMTSTWIYTGELTGIRTGMGTHYFNNVFNNLFTHDTREALSPFATTALRVADSAAYEHETRWRRAIPFTICLGLALLVGFCVSGVSMLHVQYAHAVTMDKEQIGPINPWGVEASVRSITMEGTRAFLPPNSGPRESYNRPTHVVLGAGVTTVLSILRLRLAWWPLHPVGFLLAYSYPMANIWFSVFIGWLAKVLIVRFGGGEMFMRARPLFIGLIMGEAGAAAMWMVVSLVLNAMGMSYEPIRLLPG